MACVTLTITDDEGSILETQEFVINKYNVDKAYELTGLDTEDKVLLVGYGIREIVERTFEPKDY